MMDDDLEDEIFYQTIMSHGKLISRFLVSIPFHASITNVSRYLKFYLSKPECVLLLFVSVVIFALLNNLDVLLYSTLNKFHLLGANFVKNVSAKNHRAAYAGRDGVDGGSSSLFKKQANEIGSDVTWEVKSEKHAIYSVQGRRPHMEDRFSVYETQRFSIYGMYDGHGGDTAAQFTKENLIKNIGERLEKIFDVGDENSANFSEILSEEILAVDKQLLSQLKNKKDIGGSTAIVALVTKHDLIVANVGDSRAVMCDGTGSTHPLTFDHKPQQPKERNRIQRAGGFVSFNGVWRVAGILATSRALGDFILKDKNFITAEPDVLTFKLETMKPKFIILATDGLWDTYKNEEAVALVNDIIVKDPYYGARSLVMQSYNRGSLDNISVMVVKI